jgi:hypothetical protein
VLPQVQGLQVSAPFGRVQFALQVFDGMDGIRTDLTEEPALSADTLGFAPPVRHPSSPSGTTEPAPPATVTPAGR